MSAKSTKTRKAVEPSKASLREIPEIDFDKLKFLGRGLYAHLKDESEHSGRFIVRIPKNLHRAVAETAEREGVSLNQFVATVLAYSVGVADSSGDRV